jgi:hypothetical protein
MPAANARSDKDHPEKIALTRYYQILSTHQHPYGGGLGSYNFDS